MEEEDKLPLRRLSLYCPEWSGPVETWAKAFIYKNVWRVLPLYDFDDLYQELFAKYMYCCRLYPQVVDEAHFIVLFQQASIRLLHTLAGKRGKERAGIKKEMDIDTFVEGEDGSMSEGCEDADLAATVWRLDLADAPLEVKRLIERVPELDPSELYTRRNRFFRETTESYLRRLLGNPNPGVELAPALATLLAV